MKVPPDEEEAMAAAPSSYFTNDGNESYDSEDALSPDSETNKYNESDENEGDFDKKTAAKKVQGGAFSPNKDTPWNLRQFLKNQATLTPPPLFAQTTEPVEHSQSDDDGDFILEEVLSCRSCMSFVLKMECSC